MFKKLLLICLFICSLEANEATCKAYLKLLQELPYLITPQGDASQGEIEIITDLNKMLEIEKKTGRVVGIVHQDKWWIWINDACRFPNGYEYVYGRIIQGKSLNIERGVAVMPILPNGKIVLNCNFRHATRSWEIELPRGGKDPDEAPEDAARRETVEETGMVVDELLLLGKMPPDTGVVANVVPIYAAKILKSGETHHENTEAIEEILALSIDEIKQAFVKGYYECKIRGVVHQVNFRDPFLAYAILLYELIK